MSKTKGKTWEEIYGIEGARLRRLISIPKTTKNRLSKKGLTLEQIYGEKEAKRRREFMRNNNPSIRISDKAKISKSKKLSKSQKYISATRGNNFKNKKHSLESIDKMSKAHLKHYKYIHDLYDIVVKCKFCGKDIYTDKRHSKIFCNTQCCGYFNIFNGIFNKKANSYEQKIIDMNIQHIKYTGDHSFWIDLLDENNKIRKKNPDFIITPYKQNKKVIEVIGRFWHPEEEVKLLHKMYENKNIKVLFLYDEDIKSNELRTKIEEFICK